MVKSSNTTQHTDIHTYILNTHTVITHTEQKGIPVYYDEMGRH